MQALLTGERFFSCGLHLSGFRGPFLGPRLIGSSARLRESESAWLEVPPLALDLLPGLPGVRRSDCASTAQAQGAPQAQALPDPPADVVPLKKKKRRHEAQRPHKTHFNFTPFHLGMSWWAVATGLCVHQFGWALIQIIVPLLVVPLILRFPHFETNRNLVGS